MADEKITWVQAARGLTSVLVVFGHAMYGVEAAVGLNREFFQFTDEFFTIVRMPFFFFIAGIFAVRSLKRPLPVFLNRTILHLIYIYVVWCTVQFSFRFVFNDAGNTQIDPLSLLKIHYIPINVLWFIYVLLLYYALTRLLRAVPVTYLVGAGAALSVTGIHTDLYWLGKFAAMYVFFLLGYAEQERALAAARRLRPVHGLVAVPLYGAVTLLLIGADLTSVRIIHVFASIAGIWAMIAMCVALNGIGIDRLLRFVGDYSLPIFVSHTIFTAGIRVVAMKAGIDSPWLLLTAAFVGGVACPVALALTLDRVGFPWLFRKPSWFRVGDSPHTMTAREPAG